MGDFKSYRRDEAGKSGAAGDERQAVNLAAAMAKAFAGKSEGQILATIIAQAE